MDYGVIMKNVMSRMQSTTATPPPVTPQTQPQENKDETLLNNIGLAINREGGMNN